MPRRITAGEFNHYPVRARELAREDDVIVEMRGEPVAVVLSYERYRQLTGAHRTPLDVIADPEVAEIELQIPRFGDGPGPVDLD